MVGNLRINRDHTITIDVAKRPFRWAKQTSRDRISIGVIYSPIEERVYFNEVLDALQKYFWSVQNNLNGKTKNISTIGKKYCRAEKKIEYLIKQDNAS